MAPPKVRLPRNVSLGTPEVVTILSGVATITRSFVRAAAESGTTDTIDTITKADAKIGDLLYLEADVGDTITVDDANINLGDATRVLTNIGQYLVLMFNGTEWAEMSYCAGDNT